MCNGGTVTVCNGCTVTVCSVLNVTSKVSQVQYIFLEQPIYSEVNILFFFFFLKNLDLKFKPSPVKDI